MGYTLLEQIGSGGMGCVHKGKDNTTGRIVAIKMMSNKLTCYPEYRDLFMREAQTMMQLDHPSIVHILDHPFQDSLGNLCLPMEYIEGQTLQQIVFSTGGPLPIDKAIDIMTQILDAIQYVHDHNKIHRDLKPSNIMLKPDGSVCVIDFGIAKDAQIGASGHTVGQQVGTDGYMSPEQASGLNIDTRTDIYSLGCVFYFILTGQHAVPKGNDNYTTISNILNRNVEPPSNINPLIPQHIDRAVLCALDKNMTRRHQSARDFIKALKTDNHHCDPEVSIGSMDDNDIIINSPYVSRHHLRVKGLKIACTNGDFKYAIEIIDHSLNKTGIDGRPLHKASKTFDYNGMDSLPQVLLAARTECALDWDRVVQLLKDRGWHPKDILPPEPDDMIEPEEEGLNTLVKIICILFPVIGLILWCVYLKRSHLKSVTAIKMAAIGLVVNLLLIVMALTL